MSNFFSVYTYFSLSPDLGSREVYRGFALGYTSHDNRFAYGGVVVLKILFIEFKKISTPFFVHPPVSTTIIAIAFAGK